MNFNPLFLTIGLVALIAAIVLKRNQLKSEREMKRQMKAAIESQYVKKAKEETLAKALAGERKWREL